MTTSLELELGTQETPTLEFKRDARNRNAVREAICALANDLTGEGGGDLIIGVRADGVPDPTVDTSDVALLTLTGIADEGRILPKPSMIVSLADYRDSRVIRIHVNAAQSPPVRFDGVVWVRPGPLTRRASADDERVLAERRLSAHLPFDTQPAIGAVTSDLDLDLFRSTYLPAAVDPTVLAENHRPIPRQLASVRFADADADDTPTVVGLLVVGFDPTSFLPGAHLQFVRFDGVDFDAPIIDDQEIRGNVIGAASLLETVLKGHLHTRLVETGGFREEARPTFPFEALREVCMNAIMHRNYESSHAPIRLLWFTDRLEIANPGGPFGQVRADNFERVNDYRNPSLAAAMKDLGYVNRFGRGIGRIRAALARNGNPAPEFLVDASSWTVILRTAS